MYTFLYLALQIHIQCNISTCCENSSIYVYVESLLGYEDDNPPVTMKERIKNKNVNMHECVWFMDWPAGVLHKCPLKCSESFVL